MHPGASEVDRAGSELDRPGPTADPIAGLEHHHIGSGMARRIRGRQPGQPGSDYDQSHGEASLAPRVTLLAVRSDRYIGSRDDSGNPAAVGAYLDALSS